MDCTPFRRLARVILLVFDRCELYACDDAVPTFVNDYLRT